MKLYGDYGSGSCRRVAAVLHHLCVDFELVFIDLFKGENRTPEFLSINPNGTIPTLVDGDVVLYEAAAINLYLTVKYNSDLHGRGNDRFQVLQWMFWGAEHFRQGPPILFEERIVKAAQGQPEDSENVEKAYSLVRKYSAVLDAHLSKNKFVVGDYVTLADLDLAAPFSQLPRTRPPFEEFPHMMAWQRRLTDEFPGWRWSGEKLEERMKEVGVQLGLSF
jgi:glutathione S-transferase